MNDHQQPVRNRTEKATTNMSNLANETHRIAVSPRKVKTQIAKISYTSSLKAYKKQNANKQSPQFQQLKSNSTDTELDAIEITERTRNEFSKKKDERENEYTDLKFYLSEITINKSTNNGSNKEKDKDATILVNNEESQNDNNTNKTVPTFRRSKTEIIFSKPMPHSERHIKIRTGAKERSKSSQPPETKSHELLPIVPGFAKRKSYNVEEARKFLEEQKRRRRSQQTASSIENHRKTAFEKEQIKNRLEELRQNSRAIIAKNVNRKNIPSLKNSTKNNQKNTKGVKEVDGAMVDCVPIKTNKNIVNDCRENLKDLECAYENQSTKIAIDCASSQQQNDKIKPVNPEDELKAKNRIGLLRKQGIKDHSFSAIREFSFAKPKSVEIPQAIASDSTQKNYELAQSKLDAKMSSLPQSDLPYWLKPSAVQIYPYNFIIAVRRKLEALADVKPPSGNKITSTKDLTITKSESDAKLVSKTSKKSIQDSSLKQSCDSKIKKSAAEKPVLENIISPNDYTVQSQPELNSNLSSISIQLMSSSNTVSKTTSKISKSIPLTYAQSEASTLPSEDDTTISSSIFNSPEKNSRHLTENIDGNKYENKNENSFRAISPLSFERVENLMISSNKKLERAIAARHVNTNRGGDIMQFNKMDQIRVHKDRVKQEIDFSKLLDEFNRSLSQVIEVNDRLKTTIDKSHEICCTQPDNIKSPKYNSSKESDEYTEDFEKNSTQRSQDVNSELHNNERDRKHANIKISNQITEHEVTKSDPHELNQGDFTTKRSNAVSKSQVNSSSNSFHSNVSSEISQQKPFPMTEVLSPQELYKRLHKIEKFKQTILSSQKVRRSKDYDPESEPRMGHDYLEIGGQEKSERVELASPPNEPSNERKESLNSNSITEDIQLEGISEIEIREHKSTPLVRNATDPRDYQVSSKYVTSSHKTLEIFDHSSLEISLGSSNNDSLSDSTCSYTNVGLYEKLIRNETTKSEHLTALLKMREKALFDRTKGQIAYLEVQKERCKSKGLLLQISAIKKKQRAILLNMEKEREEIKRLLQSTTTTTSTESSAYRTSKAILPSPKESDKSAVSQKSSSKTSRKIAQLNRNEKRHTTCLYLPQSAPVNTLSKNARGITQTKVESNRSIPVVRANYSLESSRSLEELLRKRESDLRRRREHVERLMQWHRRLDQEEAEVLQMENAVLTYSTENNQLKTFVGEVEKDSESHAGVVPIKNIYTDSKVQNRLKQIENSLRELNTISSTHTTAGSNKGSEKEIKPNTIDCVRTTGSKLNKLWRRLTSQQIEKYEPNKYYQLSKSDLEHLYEAAKAAVLQDFAQNEGSLAADLLEKSISILSNNISQTYLQQYHQSQPEGIIVPSLNLCTSSEPSDKEEELWEETEETSAKSLLLGNYSPSTAAENFQLFTRSSGSETLCPAVTQSSSEANIFLTKNKSELNLYLNMRHFSPCTTHDSGLMRSLSDTAIYNKNRSAKDRKKAYKENYAQKFSLSLPNTESLPPYDVEGKVHLSHPSNTSQQALPEQATDSSTYVTQPITLASNFQTKKPSVITSPGSAEISVSTGGTVLKAVAKFKGISAEVNQCKVSSKQSSSSISLIPTTYDGLNSACDEEDIEISSQHITSCAQSSHESEYSNIDIPQDSLSYVISADASREEIQNDGNVSKNSQPLDEHESEEESVNSKTFVSQSKMIQSEEVVIENETLNTYEDDFESTSDLTQIDDLSLPHFESIVDLSLPDDNGNEGICENDIQYNDNTNEFKDVPICSGVSEKHKKSPLLLTNTEIIPASPPPSSSVDSTRAAQNINNEISIAVGSVQLMPDIINELEIRRCQQILLENEQIRQFDNNSTVMPYMYVREIPNKPPPPYVPPAHGSPMTTIFPSEGRIKEISYRRTHELYCELLKTDYISETGEKLPSIMDERITNIYERIILDICREYLDEHSEVLKESDPINFYTQLAFFNPPNRLRCMQESVYKEVRRCLAMDKTNKRRTPIYSVYGQRAKRDHIGKIIIQEMYDEDEKWCNFHREENEVVELIIYEMVGNLLTDVSNEVLIEEGGIVEISNEDNGFESDENINSSFHETQPNNSV